MQLMARIFPRVHDRLVKPCTTAPLLLIAPVQENTLAQYILTNFFVGFSGSCMKVIDILMQSIFEVK